MQSRRKRALSFVDDEYAPHKETALKLFASECISIMRKDSLRELAFYMDEFTSAAVEDSQTFVDCVYNPFEEGAAFSQVRILKEAMFSRILPSLFLSIRLRGGVPRIPSNQEHPTEHIDGIDSDLPTTDVMEGELKDHANSHSGSASALPDAGAAHRLVRMLLKPPSTWIAHLATKTQSGTQSTMLSLLRMKLLLNYARCVCMSYSLPSHGQMLADSYGAIIGSLQGTDPNSPEVAVVVASLELLCDRLADLGGQSARGQGALEAVEIGLSILVIALELVPSTAVDALWDLVAGLAERLRSEDHARVYSVLAGEIAKMQDSSRRNILVQYLVTKTGKSHSLKSKL